MANTLLVILWIIAEQAMVIGLHIKSIKWTIPPKWSQGSMTVVVIPGYGGNYVFYEKVANYLNSKDYRIVLLNDFDGYESIADQSKKYAKLIDGINGEVVVIGHSRGALVGKMIMDDYPETNVKIKKLISISAPWQGSLIGYIPLKNLGELKLDSEMIEKLSENKSNLGKIVNFRAKVDDRVLPNSGLELDGVESRIIDVVGHSRILFDDNLLVNLEGEI